MGPSRLLERHCDNNEMGRLEVRHTDIDFGCGLTNTLRAPMLVILQDRGQTLRFFKPHQIPMNEEMLHEYLKQGAYEHTLPWNSMYGPGGSRCVSTDTTKHFHMYTDSITGNLLWNISQSP